MITKVVLTKDSANTNLDKYTILCIFMLGTSLNKYCRRLVTKVSVNNNLDFFGTS